MKNTLKRVIRWAALRQPIKGVVVNFVYPAIIAALHGEIRPDEPSPSGLAEALAWKTHSYVVRSEELLSGIDCGSHGEASQDLLFKVIAERLVLDGDILEFGVARGHTIRKLAQLFPNRRVYGFDSFQGLPEEWWTRPKGAFGVGEAPQISLPNVELTKGLFSESVPAFASQWSGFAALVHVDCDLYSSTMESLGIVLARCRSGTIVAFDEYYNYPGFSMHEWQAWRELSHRYRIKSRCVAYDSRRAVFQIDSIQVGSLG